MNNKGATLKKRRQQKKEGEEKDDAQTVSTRGISHQAETGGQENWKRQKQTGRSKGGKGGGKKSKNRKTDKETN